MTWSNSWLPPPLASWPGCPSVPARETLALVCAWTLHATALSDRAADAIAEVAARWDTATDVARTL
jgi:hypothetical protein